VGPRGARGDQRELATRERELIDEAKRDEEAYKAEREEAKARGERVGPSDHDRAAELPSVQDRAKAISVEVWGVKTKFALREIPICRRNGSFETLQGAWRSPLSAEYVSDALAGQPAIRPSSA
jgi:hypothetical protein